MTDFIQRIRGLAERATQGPYHACGQDRGGCKCCAVWSKSADSHILTTAKEGDDQEGACTISEQQAMDNAQYFAALPPDVVLRILAVAAAADGIGDDHHSKDCGALHDGRPCDCGVAEVIDAVAAMRGV